MSTIQIAQALEELSKDINRESFLFDLLSIYNFPKASITRLQKGDGNLSKNEGEYHSKNKFFFKIPGPSGPGPSLRAGQPSYSKKIQGGGIYVIFCSKFKDFINKGKIPA